MATPEYFRLSADEVGLFEHIGDAPYTVLNMPARINLKSDINEELFIKAMKLAVTRLPFCTIRLHKNEDGTMVQYYSDEEPKGIEIVDMSKSTDKKVDKYILKLASQSFDNNCMDSQLYNIKLIRTPDGKHIVFFCGFHIIMDTYGLMQVVMYFDKVYNALLNGTELPPVGVGIEKHIEDSWKYRGSNKEKKDIEWFCSQYETEPHFSSMNPRPSKEYIEGKNYGKPQSLIQYGAESMPIRIPAEFVKKVDASALGQNMSPQLYYVLALRTWLSMCSGSDDVMFGTTGARRSTLYQKQCGMTLAHMVTWRSIISADLSFKEALLKLNITQMDLYRHISVFMADYLEIVGKRFNTPKNMLYKTVVFTYQPYFDAKSSALEFDANHVNVGLTPYPLYLNLMPHDDSGDLWADYIYAHKYLKKENLEKFHAFMLKFIELGIEKPEWTVKEISEASLG